MTASDSQLRHIQALQFTDKAAAEALLLTLLAQIFPQLAVSAVELRPLAVSLNSFNGYLSTADGRRYFFKTHVEPESIIGEYYNSNLLLEAGYPVIRPLLASTEYGRQMLIYDLISAPSVFDVARQLEQANVAATDLDFLALTSAQNQADDLLWGYYQQTLTWQAAESAAVAPVHQLFHHRLEGRYQTFYADKEFSLPDGQTLLWEDLLKYRWNINGVDYPPLGQQIALARQVLTPAQQGWAVVGHGDAHNGNVFFTSEGLRYFDPAFGGKHHPLLDLTKPLFHNVNATWMYHPAEVAANLQISLHNDGHSLHVTHNYRPSPVRQMFWQSKLTRVYRPLLALLKKQQHPHDLADPVAYLGSALLCCPLLTLNLADRARFPAEIGLLGLCWAASVGHHPDLLTG
jgi:hypothetical protein